MSPQGIRLRVVVRRHAVPDVKLVWPCSATEDITVAKLLSQINEVVPLEGGEWGLEDYAVELADARGGTFECLHFQLVSHVLKEDDQVVYVFATLVACGTLLTATVSARSSTKT